MAWYSYFFQNCLSNVVISYFTLRHYLGIISPECKAVYHNLFLAYVYFLTNHQCYKFISMVEEVLLSMEIRLN